jgi:hypothetical protein
MKLLNRPVGRLLFGIALIALPVVAQNSEPAKAGLRNVVPGANFDLSTFKLQLPIGSGSPLEIPPSQLTGDKGFTNDYFYTDATDGYAMTLMVPATGIAFKGSVHPRTEFHEVNPDGSDASWATSGPNIMTITEKVTQVPGHTAISQIFQAAPAPSKPLCELQYFSDGTVQLLLEKTNKGGNTDLYRIGSVTPGSVYTYSIGLAGTTITVTLNGSSTNLELPAAFVGEKFFFKFGNYDQTAKPGTPSAIPGTIVKIYALRVTHK